MIGNLGPTGMVPLLSLNCNSRSGPLEHNLYQSQETPRTPAPSHPYTHTHTHTHTHTYTHTHTHTGSWSQHILYCLMRLKKKTLKCTILCNTALLRAL